MVDALRVGIFLSPPNLVCSAPGVRLKPSGTFWLRELHICLDTLAVLTLALIGLALRAVSFAALLFPVFLGSFWVLERHT